MYKINRRNFFIAISIFLIGCIRSSRTVKKLGTTNLNPAGSTNAIAGKAKAGFAIAGSST